MEFVLFGLTFGLIEVALVAFVFIGLIVGTSMDRNGVNAPKWWVFLIGMAALIGWQWHNSALSDIIGTVLSWSFWIPVIEYVVVGLAYSALEFAIQIRKEAALHRQKWSEYINQSESRPAAGSSRDRVTAKVREWLDPSYEHYSEDYARHLISDYNRQVRHSLVELRGTLELEPTVNRSFLAASIGAWTVMWPFYAISLIIGDFLVELWNVVADFFVHLSGRFVRMMFANVFKI